MTHFFFAATLLIGFNCKVSTLDGGDDSHMQKVDLGFSLELLEEVPSFAVVDVEEVPIENRKRHINISNALTRAAHGLTLSEKRLIFLALSKVDSKRPPFFQENVYSTVTAAEFADVYNVDITTAYKQLQYAAKHLYERSITFFAPSSERGSKSVEHVKVTMRWIGVVKYSAGEGKIQLYWIPELLQHIMGLKRSFTSYQLQQASALRSVYAWKLLEILSQFKRTGWAEIDIDDFCESMEASETQKANFANIRRHIIEPAILELEAKDGWKIQWKALKNGGRKVNVLRFDFSHIPQPIFVEKIQSV